MKNKFLGLCAGLLAAFGTSQAATVVDVELQLLIDVSGSVDQTEFALQRDGYVAAFQDAAVQAAILDTSNGKVGSIAVQVVFWDSSNNQNIVIDWVHLDSNTAIDDFATDFAALTDSTSGSTGIAAAISFGIPEFASNDFMGTRLVQDVSGDGEENNGGNVMAARDAAAAAGITVNGIAIGSEVLFNYYRDNVVTADGFVLRSEGFDTFDTGIRRKLLAEITDTNPVPVPAPILLMGTAIAGFMGAKRRKAAKA